MKEIERKFLVNDLSFKALAFKKTKLKQGYLNSNKKRAVRIRVAEDKAFITVKGNSNKTGISRFEWEKEIAIADAEALLQLCEKHIIIKTRYYIKSEKHIFEVDVFEGKNEGLILAEIELTHEDEAFEKPVWLGEEVSHSKKYYNVYLAKHPYKKWNKD